MFSKRCLSVVTLGITFILMSWVGRETPAATINVPADQGTIQAAINAAVSGQDEVIVSPGTYLEAINFNGKAITLRSASGDPADTIIDGTGNYHVVQCINGEGAGTVLEGFTITGGNANGSFPENVGGGMSNRINSSPTVSNCTFSGNTAAAGGGMYNYNNSSPAVSNCTFSGNTANWGGGMYNISNSSPTVSNCTFSGNTAGYGGGMYNYYSSPTVSNCTFSGDTAGDDGGGMYNDTSSPAVSNCTFSGNETNGSGGGMANYNNGNPTVSNCTFSDNTAADDGGGMYNINSSNPTVTNCILWGDSPDEIYTSSSSTLTVSFSDVQGGLPPANTVDGGGNIDADPLFVDADGPDNTAGTEDDNLRLRVGSPCFNAGSNAAVSAGVTTDLDLGPRIVNCVVDMGAYEFNGAALGDSDGDGIADDCDLCLGNNFTGDSDGDGVCDDLDVCPGFDDNDPDADSDGVPDQCDVCDGFDDTLDDDGDGVPDDCDLCPGFDDAIDYDTDGVPYGCDTCTGFDDNGPDSDGDGEPDACDTCSLPGDHNCDGIVNLLDLSLLALHWLETI